MGLNVNLVKMLGVPEKSRCPNCKKLFKNRFDDYYIECGNPNPRVGKWVLDCYCPECEHEFVEVFQVKLI